MPTWIARGILPRRRRNRLGDPFETFEVQAALARLEHEIESLRRSRSRDFAQAHHLRAALIAYEQVLGHACRLAGVEFTAGSGSDEPGGEVARVLAVAALDARGWRW